MLYVTEVSYTKENLPIIDDIWHLLEVMDISSNGNGPSDLLLETDEIMMFENLEEFRDWAATELDEDPFFIVIDTDKKSVYYYEVDPTIKFTKMEGTISFKEVKKAEKIRLAEREAVWKIEREQVNERRVERLKGELEVMKSRQIDMEKEIKEAEEKENGV